MNDSSGASARLFAFYLPQYHPIPENDAAWGAGFTEWAHVVRARPLFRGHEQPRLPGELGFYDLRVPEVREAQARLAQDHGIEGFCYWHYWMGGGRRLLERPLDEVLRSGRPDLPFCMAWANESWTGRWHGAPDRLLVEQTYPGAADDALHFQSVLPALTDPRYVRVDGAPLFIVYKPHLLPDGRGFATLWRRLAAHAGLPGIHLLGIQTAAWDPLEHGFDGAIVQPITWMMAARTPCGVIARGLRRLLDKALPGPATIAYAGYARRALPPVSTGFDHYPCVMPNWDNTPRAGRDGWVIHAGTPEQYRRLLRGAVARLQARPRDRRVVFLKSWNEWAEGNYLEPDVRWERAYLEATREAVRRGA